MRRKLFSVLVYCALFAAACTSKNDNTQLEMNATANQEKLASETYAKNQETPGLAIGDAAQKEKLNAAVKKFCTETYAPKCEGSGCDVCVSTCEKSVLDWQTATLQSLKAKNYELPDAQPLRSKHFEIFSEYVTELCNSPANHWKDNKKPGDCAARALSYLDRTVLTAFLRVPENEGDICGQLNVD